MCSERRLIFSDILNRKTSQFVLDWRDDELRGDVEAAEALMPSLTLLNVIPRVGGRDAYDKTLADPHSGLLIE